MPRTGTAISMCWRTSSGPRNGEDAAAATTGNNPSTTAAATSARRPSAGGFGKAVRLASSMPYFGISSGSDAPSSKNAGIAGSRKRKNAPLSTDASSEEPLSTKNAQNQTESMSATGIDRRATAIAPANGSHWSTRMLQNTSRRLARLSPMLSQLMSTYLS